ncbi:hypothetical protein ACSR0Z_32845 [Streptomyces viridosporus]|uniref:hypothetical protein n=1 Tax=Streptomyces viridosporus TaxID=67581 RepID=UPI00047513B6|nr:hypothetical protein [Streptomyces viridosporus]
MAVSEWERVIRARGRQRLKIIVRHIIRRPVLITGLIGLLVLFNLVKDSFPLVHGLAALAGTMLIMASMGRYRTPAEEPAREDAALPADTDGK